ncbi:MAG: hypothetical protein PVJ57_10415 [Phycisphaerae bacterium]|jgi:hypothetical protein
MGKARDAKHGRRTRPFASASIRYVLVFAIGVVAGMYGGTTVAWARGLGEIEGSKAMSETERRRICELMGLGYEDLTTYPSSTGPASPGLVDAVRAELESATHGSKAYRLRLIAELSCSDRCEDVAFLLRLSSENDEPWLADAAEEAAVTIARRAVGNGPSTTAPSQP